jgi:hypothetical protein
LSPALLPTQKTGVTAPTPKMNMKEMYKSQWKCVDSPYSRSVSRTV